MISWARALEGRWRDPLVGRDVLLGALSAVRHVSGLLGWPLISGWFGVPAPAGQIGGSMPATLYSLGGLLARTVRDAPHATAASRLTGGFAMVVLLVLLRLLTRRTWIAVAIWLPLLVAFNLNGEADRVMFSMVGVLWLTLLFRLGVLCLMVAIGLTGSAATVAGHAQQLGLVLGTELDLPRVARRRGNLRIHRLARWTTRIREDLGRRVPAPVEFHASSSPA